MAANLWIFMTFNNDGNILTKQPSSDNQMVIFSNSSHLPKKLSEILVLFTGRRLPSATFLLFIFSGPVVDTKDSLLFLR